MEGAEKRRSLADRWRDVEGRGGEMAAVVYVYACVNLFTRYLGNLKGVGRSCQSSAATFILKRPEP